MALVLNSSEQSGSYVLGFRIDPAEKLHKVHKELSSLHKLHSSNPNFGVQYVKQVKRLRLEYLDIILNFQDAVKEEMNIDDDTIDDINEIDKSSYGARDAFAAYLAEEKHKDREIVFCKELGVAMEKIKDGFTLESLWSVLPPEVGKKSA